MKSALTSLAFLLVTVSSQAHQPSLATRDGKKVDPSMATQTSSPNRTSSNSWASSHKRFKNEHPGKNRADRQASAPLAPLAPVTWIDSTGKTVGRALTESSVLVSYEDQTAILDGLSSDRVCDAKGACTFPGGMNWSNYFSVYYVSKDCTGQAHSLVATQATPYRGIPVIDGGETYIYMARGADNTRVTLGSFFTDGMCYTPNSPYVEYAAPVSAVLPASTFGTGPFFIK